MTCRENLLPTQRVTLVPETILSHVSYRKDGKAVSNTLVLAMMHHILKKYTLVFHVTKTYQSGSLSQKSIDHFYLTIVFQIREKIKPE